MKSFEKLAELADRFERKISRGQQSAQSADIEDALSKAGVKPDANAIAPLLNTAKVPDSVSFEIFVVVDKALNVSFRIDPTVPVTTQTPYPPSLNTLKGLLSRTYSGKMKQALQAAKINVTDIVSASLAKF